MSATWNRVTVQRGALALGLSLVAPLGCNEPPGAPPPSPTRDLGRTPGPAADLAQPGMAPDLGVGGSGGMGGTGGVGGGGGMGGAGDLAVAGDLATGAGDLAGTTGDPPYPSSGYGTAVGEVVDPSIEWECMVPGSDTPKKIKPQDLFDPSGKKGIGGLFFDASAWDCGGCKDIATHLPEEWEKNKWGDLGVLAISTIAATTNSHTGSIDDARKWRDDYKLRDHFYVCAASPTNVFYYGFSPAMPVVDPRSMKFTFTPVVNTYKQGIQLVTALAQKNKK